MLSSDAAAPVDRPNLSKDYLAGSAPEDWIPLSPDSFYDEFIFVAQLPDKPGAVLYFPAIQRCAKGITRWIDIPAQGQSSEDLKEPAPALTLGPKAAGGD